MRKQGTETVDYHLEVLGLIQGATAPDIKAAFRELIKIWHPDNFPEKTEAYLHATEKSKLIIEAYENLKSYEFEAPIIGQEIIRVRVKSSNIYSVGYDTESGILHVEFRKGGLYEYSGVPPYIYTELMRASSKGRFANQYIFYTFPYRVIT